MAQWNAAFFRYAPVAIAMQQLTWPAVLAHVNTIMKLAEDERATNGSVYLAILYDEMRRLTRKGGDFTVHNYVAVLEDLSAEATTVETDLFPIAALDFYTRWNLEEAVSDEEIATLKTPERGGAQGDYRRGMRRKIDNAVDCLRTHQNSKRASIPIPFTDSGSETIDWRDPGQTKCCRELYLYIENDRLSCTGVLRVQNASIFPKNIHFFGALLRRVAAELDIELGVYTHVVASLCHDRTATNC